MKTAIHEMAHQKLHALQVQDPNQTRNSKEVEAESVLFKKMCLENIVPILTKLSHYDIVNIAK